MTRRGKINYLLKLKKEILAVQLDIDTNQTFSNDVVKVKTLYKKKLQK